MAPPLVLWKIDDFALILRGICDFPPLDAVKNIYNFSPLSLML
jgi:hypothetical protein